MKGWIIEDSAALAAGLCVLLEDCGVPVAGVCPGTPPSGAVDMEDLVLVSLQLRDGGAFRLLRDLRARGLQRSVAICSSGREAECRWAERAGAQLVLQRPVTRAVLEQALARLAQEQACGG